VLENADGSQDMYVFRC